MEANIVIFGKSSIIAQNFINKDFCRKVNFINISRHSQYKKDIIFDIGQLIPTEILGKIALQIKRRLTYKKTIFILFSWCGGPRNFSNIEEISKTKINIIQNLLSIS